MYKALDRWLWSYLTRSRPAAVDGVLHVLLCVCDHFEPFHDADRAEALRRVDRWVDEFPRLAGEFRDASGRSPAHTFFYPVEQYDEEVLDRLAGLSGLAHTEVEIHLHHEGDTSEALRETLELGKERLQAHGLLSRDPGGAVRFGFIHGDWALNNSHPTARHCGVWNELEVLMEAGCYADFTMPAAPDPAQTRTINSVYYADATPGPDAHDRGKPMCARGSSAELQRQVWPRADSADAGLLLVQGPLGLNWKRRKLGLFPRLENGELSGVNPPTMERLKLWLDLGVHVLGRPDWRVVKLHTHGGLPRNMATLLGQPMARFYGALEQRAAADDCVQFHFVTARELVNILLAAEAGRSGNPGRFIDFRYVRL